MILEQEVNEYRDVINQKEKELAVMRDDILDGENRVKDRNLFFENEIKRAINLMDG